MSEKMTWRKSTRSGPWTDNCVEIAFTKSTLSGNNGSCVEVGYDKSSLSNPSGNCAEVHHHDGMMHVRDSKDPNGPYLTFNEGEWKAFIGGVKLGEFEWPEGDDEPAVPAASVVHV